MRKKVLFGFLPMCVSLAFLLNQAPAEHPLRSLAESSVKRGAGYCCPLYKIMDHGTYSTWYALVCSTNTPVSQASTVGPGKHASPYTNCTVIPSVTATTAQDTDPREGNQVTPRLKRGVAKGRVKDNPIWPESRPFTKLL